MKNLLLLPIAAGVLAAGAAHAQRPIVPGEFTQGSLTRSDPQLPDDSHYDEYVFDARRGETVVVSMESDDFDTYLYLGTGGRNRGFRELARDDDGGNGTDSRLRLVIPDDGTYVIRASSLHEDTGEYTLTLTGGRVASSGGYDPDPVRPRPRPGRERNGGEVQAGDVVEGRLRQSDPTLDNGTLFHLYTYQARRGERITLTLRSDDFDAYLVLGTRGGRHGIGEALARDDDGGGGRDSRIVFTAPRDAEYVIRVNPLVASTGRYVLEVESSLDGGYSGRPRPRPRPEREDGNGGWIEAGQVVEGWLSDDDPELDNGTPFHLYTYQGRRGERLVITLQSDEFDPYLVIGTPGGRHGIDEVLGRDDDGGGGRDSRLEVTLPRDGEYVIRVNPLAESDGSYRLEVQSDLYGDRVDDDDGVEDYDGGGVVQDVVDAHLVGSWGLVLPGARVQGDSWSSVSANAGMGFLQIGADGSYVWERNGRTRRGTLEPFRPAREAEPGAQYFLISDGRDEYYVFYHERRDGAAMTVHARTTDRVAAYGYRDGR
jgi:hypothetical protein